MINKVGREIPNEILAEYNKAGFKGSYSRDNARYKKAAPTVRAVVDPDQDKMVSSIREALEKCGLKDGMVLSFHHHFRDGDYIVNMVMAQVAAGAVVGLGTPAETVEAVRSCVDAGYCRVKIKVSPGQGLACVRAVREAFPDLIITLDANQSFSPRDVEELRAYDGLGIGWIEEPLDLAAAGVSRHENAFARLASFQHTLAMPICVDESFVNAAEADRIFAYPELRCAMVKIGKFGGIQRALEFVHRALAEGREVCMSGMYDTGISRFVHAAFQTLPGVVIPGDLGATDRYFDVDLTEPAYTAPDGIITLNAPGHDYGIGCSLAPRALAAHRQRRFVVE